MIPNKSGEENGSTSHPVESLFQAHLPTAIHVVLEPVTTVDDTNPTPVAFAVFDRQEPRLSPRGPRLFQPPDSLTSARADHGLKSNLPTTFIELDDLPLAIDGSFDRKALQDIGRLLLSMETQSCAVDVATTSPQDVLRQLWARVLHLDSAEIESNHSFFHLGGDSTVALQLVAEARKAGFLLSVAQIFSQPCLADLADALSQQVDDPEQPSLPFSLLPSFGDSMECQKHVSELCHVALEDVEDAYPCTAMQEGLMSLSAKRSDDYMLQAIMEISPLTNIPHFCRAWERVLSLAPVLRTMITHVAGEGLIQAVLNTPTKWKFAQDLNTYLDKDRSDPMQIDSALSRYAIVETENQKWFVWTIHHALYDRISMQLIQSIFSRVMNEEVLESETRFNAFVSHVLRADWDSAKAFWEWNLLDFSTESFPSLPPTVQTVNAASSTEKRIRMPRITDSNITAATILRAAWALVVHSYSGAEDITFGAVVSGRNADVPGIETMIGPTIATVPVRVHVDPDEVVSEYLQTVQDAAMEMIPYEQFGLQNIAKVSSEAEQACQFQSLLLVQPQSSSEDSVKETPGTWRPLPKAGEITSYALTLACEMSSDEIEITATFDENVVEHWKLSKMLDHLEFVVGQLAAEEPGQTVGTIGLSASDLETIWQLNQNVPITSERCVHDFVQERAESRPDAVAVSAWDGELSYRELELQASKLGQHLTSLGVKPGDIVPLCFQKSMWTIVSVLAVLKAGGTFFLLDTTQPESRLKAIMSRLTFTIMLSSPITHTMSTEFSSRVIIVDLDFISSLDTTQKPHLASDPSSTAYIVFTSGTTGEPKGVMIPHTSFSSSILHQSGHHAFDQTERVFDFASFAFDVAVNNILKTLATGGCLCIPSEDDRINNLEEAIHCSRANLAYLTPSVSRLLDPNKLPHLRTLALGGEKATADVIQRWVDHVHIIDTYGPAECTPVSTISVGPRLSGIGRGYGVVTWLVDPENHDKLVPFGVTGELLLEGPLVGQGYLGDPEKTAQLFIEDPAWLVAGTPNVTGRHGRLYKTGDLVCYNADGSLSFIGRKDTQVKIRGQRLELSEVEYHVRECLPQAKEIAVELLTPSDGWLTEELAAFITLKDGQSIPGVTTETYIETPTLCLVPSLFQKLLGERLPGYMVPGIFVVLGQMPLSISAKIDHRKLRGMAKSFSTKQISELGTTSDGEQRAPSTPSERKIQQLWAQVLGIEPNSIHIDSGFFRLGGDSIAAMVLVAEARRQGFDLSVAQVFQHSKLVDLADQLSIVEAIEQERLVPFSLLDSEHTDDVLQQKVANICGVGTQSVLDAYPCTPLQQGLLALTSEQPGDYILHLTLELNTQIQQREFQAALEHLISLVPILRTRIVQLEGIGLTQVVLDDRPEWTFADDLETYISQDKLKPMELGQPLHRLAMVGERCFIWSLHHALYDAVSLRLIRRLFSQIIGCEQIESHLEFGHFVEHLSRGNRLASEMYWTEYLSNFQGSTFPPLPQEVSRPTPDSEMQRQWAIPQVTHGNLTLATVLRAAFAATLSSYSDSQDALFGSVVSGRQAPLQGINDIIGPTVATVPVYIPVRREHTVDSYLQSIQDQATEMIAHEQFGLQNISKLSTQAHQACQFQSLLVIQPSIDAAKPDSDIGVWQEVSQNKEFASYAMTIVCHVSSQDLQIEALFDSRVIESWKISRILDHFGWMIQQLTNGKPHQTLDSINRITPSDVETIWDWNKDLPPTKTRCIHQLVQDRVTLQPSGIAVNAWDGLLTYAKLDSLSTSLATRLVKLGVTPGFLVPLLFEKSLWTIIAMLSILKTGAAFVPIDASQASERRDRILRQTGARFVLTSELYSTILLKDLQIVPVGPSSLNLETERKPLEDAEEATTFLPPSDPESVAAVFFTSGSTGEPKGVVLQHKTISTSLHYQGLRLGFNESTRALQFASYVFDPSLTEIFTTLIFGGCVCVPSDGDRMGNLSAAVKRMGITFANLTPSVARLIDPNDAARLDTMMLAGEVSTTSDFEAWSHIPHLFQGYGPTECAILCCVQKFDPSHIVPQRIGTAVGSALWVTDPEDPAKLLPVGAIGELLVEGPILASGYLSDSERTKVSFIDAPSWLQTGPVGQSRGGKLYRTGDLVYYESDGSLNFVGRKDGQVKIRGQRVELGEVEHHVLRRVPGACQVAAEIITPSGKGTNSELAAFLVLDQDSPSSEWAMQQRQKQNRKTGEITVVRVPALVEDQLGDDLPGHMVPSTFFLLENLPLTFTAKRDSKKLKQLGSSFSISQLAELRNTERGLKRMPSTETEKMLQGILAKTLNIDPMSIGLDDSFFWLGGDSITAMQVSSSARSKHVNISTAQILRQKTISRILATQPTCQTEYASTKDVTDTFDQPFPLTPIQQLYLHLQDGLDLRSIHFDQCFLLRPRGHVSYAAFTEAFRCLLARHPMLRANFRRTDSGGWEQLLPSDFAATLQIDTLKTSNTEEIRQAILQGRAALDIQKGPLVSAILFDHKDGIQSLLISIHHLVVDLISWRVLINDLENLLQGGKLLHSTALSFQAWSKLQSAYIATQLEPTNLLTLFKPQPSFLPYWGLEDSALLEKHVESSPFTLDEVTSSKILGQCNEPLSTRPVDLMISALIYSFGLVFKDRDFPTVFNEGHGREVWDESVDLSQTTGWFTTIYPIQLEGCRDLSLLDITKRTKDAIRRVPYNGWRFFASQFASSQSTDSFKSKFPLELVFNYSGIYQQVEREDAFFESLELPRDCTPESDASSRRFSLFEVLAQVNHGKLEFTFLFDRNIACHDKVVEWIGLFKSAMFDIGQDFPNLPHDWTLDSFPSAFNSYESLTKFKRELLPDLGLDLDDIQDIFPCSPMQEGMLMSQAKNQGLYRTRLHLRVSTSQHSIDLLKLEDAWRSVVQRHALLRALIVENFPGSSRSMHVILKDPSVPIAIMGAHVPSLSEIPTPESWDLHSEFVPYETMDVKHRLIIHRLSEKEAWLIIDMDHTITDAHSRGIIMNDLRLAYEGTTSPEPPQYNHFVSYLEEQSFDEGLEYWSSRLQSADPCYISFNTEIEADDSHDVEVAVTVPSVDTKLLRQVCSDLEVTPAAIIQASWAVVLSEFTGSSAPCFGMLSSGRDIDLDGVDDVFGPLMSMIPRCIEINGESTISEALREIQADYLVALPHQATPLASIHNSLGLRTMPLFNSIVSIQRADRIDVSGSSLLSVAVVAGADPTEYDVSVQAVDSGSDIKFSIVSRASIIGPHGKRLANYLHRALSTIINNPWKRLVDVDLLDVEAQQWIWRMNSTLPLVVNRTVHDLVRETVQRLPNSIAISAWDGELSYADLDTWSTRLAHHLLASGVLPNTIVPLCFEKSTWTVVATLAVLKIGSAFVLLDPSLPLTRLRSIFQQTRSRTLLCSKDTELTCLSITDAIIVIGSDPVLHPVPAPSGSLPVTDPAATLYIVFTSGTTGEPKGVVISHKSFASALEYQAKRLSFDSSTRVFDFASYAFDVAVNNMLTTLVTGGCLCIPSDGARKNDLSQAINSSGSTLVHLTPSVSRLLEPSALPKLKTLILGGEKLGIEEAARWLSHVRVWNTYGPAECTPTSTISDASNDAHQLVRIGRGVGTVPWVVSLTDENRLAPVGITGELVIEGPLVGKGYLSNPTETEKAFIMNPPWLMQGAPGYPGRSGVVYKTGDLVSYNDDGSLSYVGRRDGQIKINGQRVELEEVEYRVSQYFPNAGQVAADVTTLAGHGSTSELTAFIVLKSKAHHGSQSNPQLVSAPESFLDEIADALPSYMIPTIYLIVDEMPLSVSGKINRRKLNDMASSIPYAELVQLRSAVRKGDLLIPLTESGALLRDIWARMLNLNAAGIGLNDSFFRLGGDSITAMQVSSSARDHGLLVSTTQILRHKTISRILSSQEPDLMPMKAVQSVQVLPGESFPLGPIQQLYFHTQPDPAGCRFDQSFLLNLRQPVQYASVVSAVDTLTLSHPSFRTRFRKGSSGQWEQFLMDANSKTFSMRQLRHVQPEEMSRVTFEARQDLDIVNGPLMTALFIENGATQILFISIHHLIVDLVSWRILLADLEVFLTSGTVSSLPSLPFPTWSVLQAEYAAKHLRPNHDTANTLHQPISKEDFLPYWGLEKSISLDQAPSSTVFSLSEPATTALLGKCNDAFQTRPFELLVSALLYSFGATFSDRNLPAVFNEGHGREVWDDSIDIARTLGWFTSVYPITIQSSQNDIFDIIRKTKDYLQSLQRNGWDSCVSNFTTQEMSDAFMSCFPAEVIFNYGGTYQQLEREDALFEILPVPSQPLVGQGITRNALFEVLAETKNSCMSITVLFDHRIAPSARMKIASWVDTFQDTLNELALHLPTRSSEWTLVDYPAGFQSYDAISQFRDRTLPDLNVHPTDVEDIFPCSPMQEGILLSQAKDKSHYQTQLEFQFSTGQHGKHLDFDVLREAWCTVVRRHAILRALLLENFPGSNKTMHVILKNPTIDVRILANDEDKDIGKVELDKHGPTLHHKFTIIPVDDRTANIRLDINHAIFDAHSRQILLRDLLAAYEGTQLTDEVSYSRFIAYVEQQSYDEGLAHWNSYLADIEPCLFPNLTNCKTSAEEEVEFQVSGIDIVTLRLFCAEFEITPATLLQVAWSVVLQHYTGSSIPCFGVISSGRDIPISNVNAIMGPLVSMLTCRVRLDGDASLLETLKDVQGDILQNLAHQTIPLASVQNSLGLGSSALFNTVMSLQKTNTEAIGESNEMNVQMLGGQDNTEVCGEHINVDMKAGA